MKYNIKDFVYGGTYHELFWNEKNNPEATVKLCLPDCTAMTYGLCLVKGRPAPVSGAYKASEWHLNLINDYKCIDFDESKVESGDIIQWVDKCHTAIVEDVQDGVIYVSGSFYTGDHGKAYYNETFDTRSQTSLQEVSDHYSEKYPERFYHYWTLDKESTMVGGKPEHILIPPETLETVGQDSSRNQLETTDTSLRIRNGAGLDQSIYGHVSKGFYNVISTKKASDSDKKKYSGLECWYQIAEGLWIANVTTVYHTMNDVNIIEELERYFESMKASVNNLTQENNNLKEDMMKMNDIVKRWI